VTPTELSRPTPCDEWDVRALANHIIVWTSHSPVPMAADAPVLDRVLALAGRDPAWAAR
jgi:hypothetical protein